MITLFTLNPLPDLPPRGKEQCNLFPASWRGNKKGGKYYELTISGFIVK